MQANKVVKKVESKDNCKDKNCHVHGNLKIRGRELVGTVVRDKMDKTVAVQWSRRRYIPKFERHEKKSSKIKAHNPPCINAKIGDIVNIVECKPISKNVKFTVVNKIGATEIKERERVARKKKEQTEEIKENLSKDESDEGKSK